ncbi:hypothetical protein [Candidatus Frankia alpina]|uniref:hypothetical protein n=1 Tax=Candidatus Frankia alpina TaxID=2699483 RepID=UPI00196710B5|nr:hypothetical protein [Candidatus Frankia alpina]
MSFVSVLLRSESASSSGIENLTAGARTIALAELGSTANRNATEIVGNVAAMRSALHLADRLDEPEAALSFTANLRLVANHRCPVRSRRRRRPSPR